MSAAVDTAVVRVSRLGVNSIGAHYDRNKGDMVSNTEGIIALCKGLNGSAVTSLECAATLQVFAFLSAPVDTTPHLHSTPQSAGQRPRSRRRSRSRGGSQGQLDAAIAQVSRLALEPALKCLPLCQWPLTHAYLYLLACSLARNGLTDDELDMSGLLRLVEVLPLTKIESLECAPASSERLYVSAH